MSEKTNLISAGSAIASRNKRYVIWFYILNLVFAHFGGAAFSDQAHGILNMGKAIGAVGSVLDFAAATLREAWRPMPGAT